MYATWDDVDFKQLPKNHGEHWIRLTTELNFQSRRGYRISEAAEYMGQRCSSVDAGERR
jgi:hypothetical protein